MALSNLKISIELDIERKAAIDAQEASKIYEAYLIHGSRADKELGMSRATMYKSLKKYYPNVVRSYEPKNWDSTLLVELYNQGVTIKELADTCNADISTINRLLRKGGYDPKTRALREHERRARRVNA